jgi:hypothetical protein
MQGVSDPYTLERLTMMADEFERSALAVEQSDAADVERRSAVQGRSEQAAPHGL